MDVKQVQAYITQAPLKTAEPGSRTPGEEKAQASSMEADSVKLSKGYLEVAQAKKLVMDRAEEIRVDKVEAIRDSIDNKTYAIDAEKIAQKMTEELWW